MLLSLLCVRYYCAFSCVFFWWITYRRDVYSLYHQPLLSTQCKGLCKNSEKPPLPLYLSLQLQYGSTLLHNTNSFGGCSFLLLLLGTKTTIPSPVPAYSMDSIMQLWQSVNRCFRYKSSFPFRRCRSMNNKTMSWHPPCPYFRHVVVVQCTKLRAEVHLQLQNVCNKVHENLAAWLNRSPLH